MSWISLMISADAVHADVLSDGLLELGALSVDMHDAAAGTMREQPLFGEPGEPATQIWFDTEITALFPEGTDIPAVMLAVTQIAQLSRKPDYRLAQIEEQDWVRLTQSQFNPIQISSRLWIVPTWHKPPDALAINLILDPGLAFGTGSHPTTKLCLSWLDENLQKGDGVLDYGCGSGILAIAALKLGAGHVSGIDIDPHAVAASRENAARNQCDPSKIKFTATHCESTTQYDVVVANILANPLMMLAPILVAATRQGGHIALSGILKEQATEVVTAYEQWFNMQIAGEEEEWILLTGTKI